MLSDVSIIFGLHRYFRFIPVEASFPITVFAGRPSREKQPHLRGLVWGMSHALNCTRRFRVFDSLVAQRPAKTFMLGSGERVANLISEVGIGERVANLISEVGIVVFAARPNAATPVSACMIARHCVARDRDDPVFNLAYVSHCSTFPRPQPPKHGKVLTVEQAERVFDGALQRAKRVREESPDSERLIQHVHDTLKWDEFYKWSAQQRQQGKNRDGS